MILSQEKVNILTKLVKKLINKATRLLIHYKKLSQKFFSCLVKSFEKIF